MKTKTKRTLIVLLCVVVFIAVAGFVAYNVGIDYVQKKMISSVVDTMIDSGEITVSELDAMVNGEEISDGGEEVAPTQASGEAPDVPGNGEKKDDLSEKDESSHSDTAQKKPSPEKNRVEAVDKFTEKLVNSITREEKYAMVRLITSHLSAGDIKYLTSLIAGGLTRDERLAAYKLAKQRFSAAELSVVRDYYHRYKAQIMIEPDPVKKK